MTSHLRTPEPSQTSHYENTWKGIISPTHILIKSVRKNWKQSDYTSRTNVCLSSGPFA